MPVLRWPLPALNSSDNKNLLTKSNLGTPIDSGYKRFMKQFLCRFLKDEEGQDLIEYTLLMAFIALASAAIFLNAGGSINGIWGTASNTLVNAATSAS